MSDFIPVAIVTLFVVIAIGLIYYLTVVAPNSGKKNAKPRAKDKDALIKEANRKLAANPKDADALLTLADIYFSENEFDKAGKTYNLLTSMTTTNPLIDEYLVNLRYGLCCLKTGQTEEAHKSLLIAKAMKPEGFEVNYNLGFIEYQRKNYEKSAALLRHAATQSSDHSGTNKYLGQSLFRMKQHKEAAVYLKRAIDFEPNDKETLFYLAQTYYELGQSDNAVKIFSHLRPDPDMGPQAALFSGTINFNSRQYEKAIEDLEIGLRHQKMSDDIALEMRYRLAAAYTQMQNMEQALRNLKEIRGMNPNYKDVMEQIRKLSEFNSNRNLQVYMVAPTSEFVTLCRNLVYTFFPKAKIKITDVAVNKNENADILCEVSTSKWDDIILFRFIRSQGQIGEQFLRELQIKIKEVRAGRAFCISAGTFTAGAKQFVEARLIDLVEKEGLLKNMSQLG